MENPYQPPSARIETSREYDGRFKHSALAFLSGMLVLPAAIFTYAFFKGYHGLKADSLFWGGCFFSGLLAGAVVLLFKRIPHWLVIVLGPIIAVLTVALAHALSNYVA